MAAAVVVAALGASHAMFALANFGLAADEQEPLSVPLGEGLLALVAAVALVGAAVWLVRRSLFQASVLALAGTAPLAVFFAFTVPEHSGWGLSLIHISEPTRPY